MKYLLVALFLLAPMMAEAKDTVRAEGRSVNEQAPVPYGALAAPSPKKQVIIPYNDFLTMLSKVEHSEKLKNRAMAENGVLVKLKGEHETIIKIQADQIASCEKIVQQHERLGSTQEQIVQAVEQQLSGITGELAREKRLSRYKSEAFWLGVVAVGLWVMN